jgi:hypothetical protein
MPDKKFDLGDYVEVKDRIRILYELFPMARIDTVYELTSEPDGKPKVIVEADVWRHYDDPVPAGHGTSWMYLPGATTYTRGSEIENAETSAVGRAIGMLGILIVNGMASRQEVENKQSDRPALDRPVNGLIGTVEVGKPPVDMELRIDKEQGPVYGFKLKNGTKAFQALAIGPLAQALSTVGLEVGTRVTVEGTMVDVPWQKAGKDMPPFSRVMLSRVHTPDWTLPMDVPLKDPLPGRGGPLEPIEPDDEEAAEILRLELAEAQG